MLPTSSGLLIAITALFILVLPSSEANARGSLRFGDDSTIHFIKELTVKGPKSEELSLGYKTTTKNFALPYYLQKDGYVLKVKGTDGFYILNDKLIRDMQGKGQLPSPLPPFTLSWVDYVFGYLLWVVIAGLLLWGLISMLWKKRTS